MMNKSFVFLLLVITGCQSAVIKTSSSNYPDLKEYFSKEIKRLEKERPEVQKSVHFNNLSIFLNLAPMGQCLVQNFLIYPLPHPMSVANSMITHIYECQLSISYTQSLASLAELLQIYLQIQKSRIP